MNKITYKLPEGDLASRNQAILQRHKIEVFLNKENFVELDLSGICSISDSYSDEIFGVLVVKFGVSRVLRQIKIRNASPSILRNIAKVIQRRSNEVTSTEIHSVEFDGAYTVS